MEKFIVDYRTGADFIGIRIFYDFLEEGLEYAKKNNIKEVCIMTNIDWSKKVVNFDFLKGMDFIETFHWIVPLSKKSKIEGLYYLYNLKDLRCDIEGINLSKFKNLEVLNIGHYNNITGWDDLKLLTRLLIGGVESDDLSFLSQVTNLESLRLIGGKFTTLKGIENCDKLKYITIQGNRNLVHIKETLEQMKGFGNICLERCKNVNPIEINLLKEKVFVI
ncbi:MAG: hypothetical protein LBE34_14610 [Flavobacteriaceae bacterium]|jgi:hypothetical protein|nr:hypothetical protein [Flavobacteriaceae bacterium]